MKWSKLSKFKIKKILRCFAHKLTSAQAAQQLHVNRHTTDSYYQYFREQIANYEEKNLKQQSSNIEIDESYFGSRHFGDKRGRGAQWRIPVIGILKRKGLVYAHVIPDVSRKTLVPIIEKPVKKSKSNLYTDKWRSYDGLVFQGYKHYRINHSPEFVRSHNHINGIESFWSYTKRKMRKHNGIRRDKFYWYLKQSEFRFNHRQQDMYKAMLQIIKV